MHCEPKDREHGEREAGSVQRWSDRDRDHYHGPGDESAAQRRTGRLAARPPGLLELRIEFYLRGDLLEQSPPHLQCRPTGERHDTLGQSSLAVLALVDPVCYAVDGREPFRHLAGGGLWGGPAPVRNRLGDR